jgi:hypothetical protein
VEHAPVGCVPKSRNDYGEPFAAAVPPDPFPCAVSESQSSGRASTPTMRRSFATCARTAPILPIESSPRTDSITVAGRELQARAKSASSALCHWYVDGGQPADHRSSADCVSYKGLEPVRAALLKNIDAEIRSQAWDRKSCVPTWRDFSLRSWHGQGGDEVLDRFQVRLFTEGSGTQIFSTTFAQWTAREALRRAQPLTLLCASLPGSASGL